MRLEDEEEERLYLEQEKKKKAGDTEKVGRAEQARQKQEEVSGLLDHTLIPNHAP